MLLLFSVLKKGDLFNKEIIPIAEGYARNSINTVIFRKNSIASHKDYQIVSFYDGNGNVILAKRKLSSSGWEVHKTQYKGKVEDAHNSISIMIDGDGYLHMAWNHHGDSLNYCKSISPDGLELTCKMIMTGYKEENVTYPEFYRLPGGDLIFAYRDGSSGNGNMIMNYYDTKNKTWSTLHDNLIDGEGQRNAYWQMTVGADGTLHLSWVWRESWDVATNHDLCYAKSLNNGKTWRKSNGEIYQLPINVKTAEYAAVIPQGSELINQTSICGDSDGHPYIANYWTPEGSKIPQYHLVYNDGNEWKTQQISKRETAFSLSGGGTKRIPISRPQIAVDDENTFYLIYRDIERNNLASVAVCKNLDDGIWTVADYTQHTLGQWEPTFDTELWRSQNKLHILIQNVGQGDAETLQYVPPQIVAVLELEKKN
ncbi:MAG: BNR repeat-containing protein [Ignavibacteria bacterium]